MTTYERITRAVMAAGSALAGVALTLVYIWLLGWPVGLPLQGGGGQPGQGILPAGTCAWQPAVGATTQNILTGCTVNVNSGASLVVASGATESHANTESHSGAVTFSGAELHQAAETHNGADTIGRLTVSSTLTVGVEAQSGAVRFGAATSVVTGTLIAHGFTTTPTAVLVTGKDLINSYTNTVTIMAINATSFTVGIDGGAVTIPTLYWMAGK